MRSTTLPLPALLPFFHAPFACCVVASMALAVAAPAHAAPADPPGRIRGVVRALGQPVADAHVRIVDLSRHVDTDESGAYSFDSIPAGRYLLEATSTRLGKKVARASVSAGLEAVVDFDLDRVLHAEAVVVSASTDQQALSETAKPISVLTGLDLQAKLKPTLGETLADVPGVASTYFGPGASRPVIRGLAADRVRMLQAGVGTADVSNTSPDHAVSFDPLTAEQIEVVRGPAALLYGSSAIGGVVNIIDGRIPEAGHSRAAQGVFDLTYGTNANERSGAAAVFGGRGTFAWHADLSHRRTDDLRIPVPAESTLLRLMEEEGGEEQVDEAFFGRAENSATETTSGALGLSLVGSRGFVGASFSGFDTTYGVPGHHHGAEHAEQGDGEEAEEEQIRIELNQRRVDLKGAWAGRFGVFRGAKIRGAFSDYAHTEFEGSVPGTVFDAAGYEARLELPHRDFGAFRGSLGASIQSRDLAVTGEEAFVPENTQRSLGAFVLEEIGAGATRGSVGFRYERQTVDPTAGSARTFDGVSLSAGVSRQVADGTSLGLTVSRSTKLPTAEELYSDGPHAATRAYEVGDSDLGKEASLGLDLTLRRSVGVLRGSAAAFLNSFTDYIYQAFTGEEHDGLPVLRYAQGDARFWGLELETHLGLIDSGSRHLDLTANLDFVRARLNAADQPLPRTPPSRMGVGLEYHDDRWIAALEVRGAQAQRRLAPRELETAGHTLVNAHVGYRLFRGRTVTDILLRGTNLADAEARNHVSYLKDLLPLPGRDVRLSVRTRF